VLKLNITLNPKNGQMMLDDSGSGVMSSKLALYGFLEVVKEAGGKAIDEQAAKSVQAVPPGSGEKILADLSKSAGPH
jgi:hypothetical protein